MPAHGMGRRRGPPGQGIPRRTAAAATGAAAAAAAAHSSVGSSTSRAAICSLSRCVRVPGRGREGGVGILKLPSANCPFPRCSHAARSGPALDLNAAQRERWGVGEEGGSNRASNRVVVCTRFGAAAPGQSQQNRPRLNEWLLVILPFSESVVNDYFVMRCK